MALFNNVDTVDSPSTRRFLTMDNPEAPLENECFSESPIVHKKDEEGLRH